MQKKHVIVPHFAIFFVAITLLFVVAPCVPVIICRPNRLASQKQMWGVITICTEKNIHNHFGLQISEESSTYFFGSREFC